MRLPPRHAMLLTVLGAGPAYTDRRGAAGASYLLSSGGDAIVLDLGQGAFPNLASSVEPSRLAGILVSHLHPDHFIDLVPLRHYLRFEFEPPRRVRVVGPAGLSGRLDGVNGESGFAAVSLDVEAYGPDRFRVGAFEVEAFRVTHTDASYALRVTVAGEGGAARGVVYSGDCGRADDLLAAVRPGDTLLSEASFGAGPVPPGAQHMTGGDAGRVAATCGAARLLLTHIQMGFDRGATYEAARGAFAGPVQLVLEGDCFEI